ncbi:unnamed protein product [Ostreobium quekettii]|uniref:Uncharacterized protein n=1 Tax=Ostreobium quekettii TaxID=121088 RepID=A0A8S1J661_9CHLO|nr:unnamed protein product [Ostreobium quekettii]|eukprot:evm.model.scf_3537.1 EVM.evm.TU.scf_3537.1   scf_3537:2824-3992(+)
MNRLASVFRQGLAQAACVAEDSSSRQRLGRLMGSLLGDRASPFGSSAPCGADVAVAAEDLGHATGLERIELEAEAKGASLFEEEWLSAPFGTIDNPVQVTSFNTERIVGVPDPDDDSIVVWGIVKENEPPKQLVENGEYFILKKVEAAAWNKDH